MSNAKIFLVGVGPGDPDLITRKAERVLRSAAVVYHPGRDDHSGFAWSIVAELIGPQTAVRAAAVELSDAADRYESLAERLVQDAHAGRCVAFITEGDPVVYSTASRLLDILQTRWPDTPVELVSGVTSLTAAAAAAGLSLVQAGETLVVIPACHHPDRLEAWIEQHDRAVLVKISSVFGQVVSMLRRRGWLGHAVFVEKVGTTSERIIRDLAAVDARSVSYFSAILIDRRVGPVPAVGQL
jgi:precorrin-2/cobalt-factor-2 C20-methyltransferase